ncbi:DUF5134 domain-containing protein [Streptomyces clavifer]|uniref:DUF5134 domain-containing protein n=1 Tax=Streptomyces clavifer TaxID=68188 RepID=UPI0036879965
MSAPDVVYCMLTVLFLAAAIHGLRQGLLRQESGWRSRVGHLLHAAMALAMAAMPWSWGRALPLVPQTAFFAAAALWFCSTAVSHRRGSRRTTTARSMQAAAGMAAMAWMSHSMASSSHGGHTVRQAEYSGPQAGGSAAGDLITVVLALYLLICSLWSLTRGMPTLRNIPDLEGAPLAEHPYAHFWDGTMALGTVVMLLMPH